MASNANARARKSKAQNPISSAVRQWSYSLPPTFLEAIGIQQNAAEILVEQAPKRWVVYEPMVLLPSGSFTSVTWSALLSQLDEVTKGSLWDGIVREISKKSSETLTHLAANEGIPLRVSGPLEESGQGTDTSNSRGQGRQENIIRSPSGLHTLYGDFGPPAMASSEESAPAAPGAADFEQAFWVSTRQNGIYQTWAPRWTMFSRGNVKEKARLLGFHREARPCGGEAGMAHRTRTKEALRDAWAVDLYGGIGYFVFSYARLGMRVLCWEINPWSVEGLRRGAHGNGWSVKVVKGRDLQRPSSELVTGQERIVVFLEDNKEAERRTRELRACGTSLDILHVNCGLLPRSNDSWQSALRILGTDPQGWLHLHENVGTRDINGRRQEIQHFFDGWIEMEAEAEGNAMPPPTSSVEHVELVKTFAPDVWHCVFDVHIKSSR